MTVSLKPDLKPFYAGAYFPAEQLTAVVHTIAKAWQTDRAGPMPPGLEPAADDKLSLKLKTRRRRTGVPDSQLSPTIKS